MTFSFGFSLKLVLTLTVLFTARLFAQPVEVKVVASDGQASDRFGIEVAVDGEWAAVTAPSRNTSSGAVYVYQYDNDSWIERDILVGSNISQMEIFGHSVDIWDNYLISGALRHPEVGFGPGEEGAVYIFKLDNGIWAEQAKIQASDKQKADEFGHDTAIYEDTILAGAPFDSAGGKVSAGKVFIFKRDNSNWVEEDSLVASDGNVGDNFGRAVDIYGDYAMVGSQNPIGDNRGAVYVFHRNGNDWTQIDKLVPDDLEPGANFGISVSMDGDAAIIGALSGDGNEVGSGAAYVFRRNGSTWQQEAKLIGSDAVAAPLFALRVGISGDYAVVGARNQAVGSSLFQGAAYLFKRNGATWTEELQIISGDGEESDSFGSAVAIDGDTVIVGAAGDAVGKGAAYIYIGSTTTSINDPKGFSSPPTGFALEQNYPNPFNPSTTIQFALSRQSEVTLSIYNINGQLVRALVGGTFTADSHSVVWDGRDDQARQVTSGLYLTRIQAGEFVQQHKMLLIK